ncbi:MAG: transporter related protein [Sphaerisporangium sp.]|nr:transporter related protein [Sphaerisporangium sp.]
MDRRDGISAQARAQGIIPDLSGKRSSNVKVSVAGLSKSYMKGSRGERFEALRNVNLDVYSGEFLSIIGPSGSGKTTLLKCIDGIANYQAGTVTVTRDPSATSLRDRAFVFQDFGLLPWRTILANVALPLELLGMHRKEREERAMSYLRLVGLEKTAKDHPHELSGGMRQRVGLARALAVDPDVLLMDEPLGALDEQTREVMQAEILRICGTGRTVIFVTHSVDEAIFVSDRVVVMSNSPGHIKAIFTVDIPKPRTQLATRAHPRFSELREAIWAELGVTTTLNPHA